MTQARIAAGLRLRALSGEWIACHPEWWLLAAGVGAWLILLLPPAHEHSLLCTSVAFGASQPFFSGAWSTAWLPLTGNLAGWVLMTIAMMAPLIVLPVRHVAFRSFRDRRHRAIGEFLAGYFGVWIGFGVVLIAMLQSVGLGGRDVIPAVGYLMAAAWQLTPSKRIALWRCHRTVPLAPEGWLADLACLRFGIGIGASCLASCWALMALPMLASHGLGSMACIEAAMIHERYQRRMRPRMAASVALLALAFLVEAPGLLA
ncbi:MAG TPA: DUF2182 domain-containing protein [Rhodopila sp.]